MASSRKSNSADLCSEVAAGLRSSLSPGANLLLGLSGGVDSVVLLDVLTQLAPSMRFSLRALYVDHGISPNAQRWAEFCAAACGSVGVPFTTECVDIAPYRALGLEGAARQARYEALARQAADFIVLAQHRDDQVETVLLQLARGAGARGLAGMPQSRALAGSNARLLRPLLSVSRAMIEAYARARGLTWVEDESNANLALRRNFVRARVLPALESIFPSVRTAIARSAANLSDAAELLDTMADEDLATILHADALDVPGLRERGEARARNALRRWCELRGAPWPGSARLLEVLRQAGDASEGARVGVNCRGWTFRRYRRMLFLDSDGHFGAAALNEVWDGDPAVPLLQLGGVLRFKPEIGRGLASARLQARKVTLRTRQGGERMQLHPLRPHRTLKNLFQESATPPWRRHRVPLIYCDDELVCVPGLGEDCEWRATGDEPGLIVSWELLR